jgi:hypothetical protein
MLPPENMKKGPATTAPRPNEIAATRAEVREALRRSLADFDELAKNASRPDAAGALLIAEAIHLQTAAIQKSERHHLGAIRDQTWVLREHAANIGRLEGLLVSIAADLRRLLERGAKR